jgi:hypothetical protein
MFRLLKRVVRSHRERLLSLVMLPAFLLTTLPNAACICGDGHREAHCNVTACRAVMEGNTTGVSCGCACCQTKSGEPGGCCKAKQSGNEPRKDFPPGLAAKTGNCCLPIVESPAPAQGIEKISLPFQFDVVVSEVLPTIVDAGQFHLARRTLDFHGPPPLDAVVVYLHLTI